MKAQNNLINRNYYEGVLARFASARNELSVAYELLQGQAGSADAQLSNALAGLANSDVNVRRAASRILVQQAANLGEQVDFLIGRLSDYDYEVLENLFAILAALGGKALKAIDALNRHSVGKNQFICRSAQRAIGAIIDDFGRGLVAGICSCKISSKPASKWRRNLPPILI